MPKKQIRNQILGDLFRLLGVGLTFLLLVGSGAVLWAQRAHLDRYTNALAQRLGPEVRSLLIEGRRSELRSFCERVNGIEELVSFQIRETATASLICDVRKARAEPHFEAFTKSSRTLPISYDIGGDRALARLEFTVQDSRLLENAALLMVVVLVFLSIAAIVTRRVLHRQFDLHLRALEDLSGVLAAGGGAELLIERTTKVTAVSLEVENLRAAVLEYSQNLKSLQEIQLREKLMAMHRDLLRQVAHDIRSPLSALKMIAFSKRKADESQAQELMIKAISRIEEQLREAMVRSKEPMSNHSLPTVTGQALKQIAEECLCLFDGAHPEVLCDFVSNCVPDKRYVADNNQFRAMIMNALSNGLFSLQQKKSGDTSFQPYLKLEFFFGEGSVCVSLTDNGIGIPSERVPLIGKKGFSHGKVDGNGLGVWGIRQNVASWGGQVLIDSTEGEYCRISITLPEDLSPEINRISS